jgi:predicted acetyltransferase
MKAGSDEARQVSLKLCSEKDLDELAALNKELIQDEGHDNLMNLEQLKERMRGFINTTYKAYIFVVAGGTGGYALIDTSRTPCYLRQFFICRGLRRKGYGRAAFDLLLGEIGSDVVDIEVLAWNGAGRAFWKSLGFAERSVSMRHTG